MEDFIYEETVECQELENSPINIIEEENLCETEDNNLSNQGYGMPDSGFHCPIDDPDPFIDDIYSCQEPYYNEIEIDRNGDGQTDMLLVEADTDSDGIVDIEATISDNNYDGDFESSFINSDEDGDGFIDTQKWEMDTNGDGIVDSEGTVIDTNRNGFLDEDDTLELSFDSNQGGMVDTYKMQVDTDGDGKIDYAVQGKDYNNDGEFDSLKIFEDTTENGEIDTMTELFDSTGDGKLDMAEIHHDYDGDGIEDWTQICSYNPENGTVTPLNNSPEYGNISATFANELPNYEPNENYPDGISGDPVTSMEHWEFQGNTNRCALYSQMFIVEEFTGQDIDIEEFTKIAFEQGWFNDGTSFLNTNKMLNYYGIENEMSFHNDISDIESCLDSGGKVIVAIDADEIWYGEGNDLFSPNSAANHAVEVIGIDYTNPERPMVILNDSGNPNGKGVMVPLDDFMDAWKDSECQMIKCYPNK